MTMASTTKRTSSENGFSLIEVLIAIVILTIGLLSLAQMMVLSTKSEQPFRAHDVVQRRGEGTTRAAQGCSVLLGPGRQNAERATGRGR